MHKSTLWLARLFAHMLTLKQQHQLHICTLNIRFVWYGQYIRNVRALRSCIRRKGEQMCCILGKKKTTTTTKLSVCVNRWSLSCAHLLYLFDSWRVSFPSACLTFFSLFFYLSSIFMLIFFLNTLTILDLSISLDLCKCFTEIFSLFSSATVEWERNKVKRMRLIPIWIRIYRMIECSTIRSNDVIVKWMKSNRLHHTHNSV